MYMANTKHDYGKNITLTKPLLIVTKVQLLW